MEDSGSISVSMDELDFTDNDSDYIIGGDSDGDVANIQLVQIDGDVGRNDAEKSNPENEGSGRSFPLVSTEDVKVEEAGAISDSTESSDIEDEIDVAAVQATWSKSLKIWEVVGGRSGVNADPERRPVQVRFPGNKGMVLGYTCSKDGLETEQVTQQPAPQFRENEWPYGVFFPELEQIGRAYASSSLIFGTIVLSLIVLLIVTIFRSTIIDDPADTGTSEKQNLTIMNAMFWALVLMTSGMVYLRSPFLGLCVVITLWVDATLSAVRMFVPEMFFYLILQIIWAVFTHYYVLSIAPLYRRPQR